MTEEQIRAIVRDEVRKMVEEAEADPEATAFVSDLLLPAEDEV